MNTRTRWTATVVVLMSLLGACSTKEAEVAGAGMKGTITVAASGGEGEIKALQSVADAFMSTNPGTTVKLDTVAQAGEMIAKLTAAFVAGNAPDVFLANYRRLGGLASKGVIEEVVGGDTSSLYEKPLEAFRFDGKLLCLPSNASSMVVYYNTALFTKAGVPAPKADWSWATMLATAKALKAKGISAIGFETALIRLAPFVWSNGGEIADAEIKPTMVDLSSSAARQAIQFLLDLQKTGQSATDRAAQEPESAFTAGKTAMYLDSRRAVPGFRKAKGLAFDVAGVPTKKQAVSVLHSDGYCVTKSSTNKALARAFARFAVTGDGAKLLAASGRTVPEMRSVANSESFLAPHKAPKSSKVWLDQLANVRPLPQSANWNEAEEFTEEVLVQLFAGKLTIDKAIAQITAGTKQRLAKA